MLAFLKSVVYSELVLLVAVAIFLGIVAIAFAITVRALRWRARKEEARRTAAASLAAELYAETFLKQCACPFCVDARARTS
jgi:hypothetical protein